ncbi:MAG: hypothetical protein AB7F41_04895 [Methylocystis sp.]|uniref:hypothetical protein n=1 Tax=Methylocystis sp. TaxID=1911079 RepID=UPI003D13781A
MSASYEAPIRIRELVDEGLHLPTWGRFNGAELIYALCVLPSGQARVWHREPLESAELFSARICRDIIESVRGRCEALV